MQKNSNFLMKKIPKSGEKRGIDITKSGEVINGLSELKIIF